MKSAALFCISRPLSRFLSSLTHSLIYRWANWRVHNTVSTIPTAFPHLFFPHRIVGSKTSSSGCLVCALALRLTSPIFLDWTMFAECLVKHSCNLDPRLTGIWVCLYKAAQLVRYWKLYSCITRLLCQDCLALLAVVFPSCTTSWHGEFLSAFLLSFVGVRPALL